MTSYEAFLARIKTADPIPVVDSPPTGAVDRETVRLYVIEGDDTMTDTTVRPIHTEPDPPAPRRGWRVAVAAFAAVVVVGVAIGIFSLLGDDGTPVDASTTTSTTAATTTTTTPQGPPTVDDLVGTWEAPGGTFVFNEDGTFAYDGAPAPDQGRYRFSEISQAITLTSLGDAARCPTGDAGSYDAAFSTDRTEIRLRLQSDSCDERALALDFATLRRP